jgi:hypothetical protein
MPYISGPGHLLGQLLERRAFDGATRERIFQHTQVEAGLARLGAQIGDRADVEAAIFRDDHRLRLAELRGDLAYDRLLLRQIKTQGHSPFS